MISGFTGNEDHQLEKPHFDCRSAIFELDSCNGNGKVCLVYKNGKPGKDHFQSMILQYRCVLPELACQPSLNEKLPETHSASEQLIGWQHTNENGLVVLERKRMGKMLELSRKLMIHNGLQVIHKQA